MDETQVPINRWVDKKLWYVGVYTHTHTTYKCTVEYYLALKKNELLPFVTVLMGLDGFMQISQREKAKYHTISLICGI